VQAQVLDLFAKVRDTFNLSMIFVTHDLRVAAQMCDHIAVMQKGCIIEHGTAEQVIRHPREPYTRKLIEAVPDFSSIIAGRRAKLALAS